MAENLEPGSIEELGDDPAPDVQDTDDGGAIVSMRQSLAVEEDQQFYPEHRRRTGSSAGLRHCFGAAGEDQLRQGVTAEAR